MRALAADSAHHRSATAHDADRQVAPRRTEPAKLSLATLRALPAGVATPSFDPAALRCGILHFGCGAFHRAHQAFLTQRAIEAEQGGPRTLRDPALPGWGIVGVSLRTPMAVRSLQAQDGLFTVLERAGTSRRATVVGTVRQLVHAPTQPGALSAAMADPAIRIVTLTVTLGGYGLHPTSGRLDVDDPVVRHDLRHPDDPRGTIGVLVAGLRRRRLNGMAPPVILSCDNVPANGRMLRQLCIDHAALQDDHLAAWIATHVQFPATMVDRIVPSGTATDLKDAAETLGIADAMAVSAEPFHQWVIERFDGPRPRWDAAGAEYVSDVAPWEASKLRLLNGGHLAVASLGLLAGCTTIAQTMALPGLNAYALRFMLDEQKPTLPPSDHDIDAYARQLLARWRNHGISHALSRVARAGSLKLHTRLLASLRDNLEAGRPAPCTLLGVAGWMCCACGIDEHGEALTLDDSLPSFLNDQLAAVAHSPHRLVDTMLATSAVFGDDLTRNPMVRDALVQAVTSLRQLGVRSAVAACIAGGQPAVVNAMEVCP